MGSSDYDPSGKVDLTDFTILAANFNKYLAPPSSPAAASLQATTVAAQAAAPEIWSPTPIVAGDKDVDADIAII